LLVGSQDEIVGRDCVQHTGQYLPRWEATPCKPNPMHRVAEVNKENGKSHDKK